LCIVSILAADRGPCRLQRSITRKTSSNASSNAGKSTGQHRSFADLKRRQIGQIPQARMVQEGPRRDQQLMRIALDEAALE
jgi:hypothetical protein